MVCGQGYGIRLLYFLLLFRLRSSTFYVSKNCCLWQCPSKWQNIRKKCKKWQYLSKKAIHLTQISQQIRLKAQGKWQASLLEEIKAKALRWNMTSPPTSYHTLNVAGLHWSSYHIFLARSNVLNNRRRSNDNVNGAVQTNGLDFGVLYKVKLSCIWHQNCTAE